jgi:hypothetical protein
MATSGNVNIPCPTNLTLYDNGGGSGNYANNVNSTVVLQNSGLGVILLSGTPDFSAGDFLRFYSGTGTVGTLLTTYTGNAAGIIDLISQPGEIITVELVTNANGTDPGFNMNGSHFDGCSCPSFTPTATATPAAVCSGDDSQLSSFANSLPTSYQISTPTYSPPPCSGTSILAAGPVGDDVASSTVTMPFNFDFFGSSYNQFGVTSNGIIQFGPGTYSTGYTPSGIPSTSTSINNIIALNFAEW